MSDDDLFWFPASAPRPGDPDPGATGAASTQPMPGAPYDFPPPAAPSGYPAGGAVASSRSRRGTAALLAVTAFVFGGGGAAIGAEAINHHNGSSASGSGLTISSANPASLTSNPHSYAAIAAKVLPSVVSINVATSSQSDTGSGVILRPDGYILTNNHVVSAASSGGTVGVTFNDGSTATAKIVGTDPLDDLAVIKVSKTGLTPATLGNSSQIQVGDPVLALGSPLGLTGTVTAGIVSAVNRPVETQDQPQQQQLDPFGFGLGNGGSSQTTQPTVIDAIQTDAAINPGNSGGALVDAAGDVIGINSAIASLGSDSLGSQSGNIGVGFAIPIDQAKTIASELIQTGHATHPLLGVQLADATSADGTDRALVRSVTANGPAAKAGIKGGDVITAIDGHATAGADAVIAAIRTFQPGDHVSVTYTRNGQSHTVTATLGNAASS
ncbi:MAG TPA: trypsin-like peptidase domain-containing protein [Mycobacteriales bacterium]|nr:trypsin-like peptidase domain-containing protein [Mycobacteriales bacterium]